MTKQHYRITVNGEAKDILAEPRELLIHTLREQLDITGPHVGCETSHCGACTVDIDGKSIKSCSVFTAQVADKEITTIEGLGSPDAMHVLQEMFREHHGLQCGYCTPGMITRAHRLLIENPRPTEAEVRFGMAGNLCRCTGYQNIVKSILAAADQMNAGAETPQVEAAE